MGNKQGKDSSGGKNNNPKEQDPVLSQYYFQLIKQYKDYRTESIQAVEIKMTEYNELMAQKDKVGREMFQDTLNKARDGGIVRLVEQSYMPLEATQEERATVSAAVKKLTLNNNLSSIHYYGADTLLNSGRSGKHNYLFVLNEPSIFKEGKTYIDLRIKYQRL